MKILPALLICALMISVAPVQPVQPVQPAAAGIWTVTQVGNELRIAYGQGMEFPQVAVLHLDDSYFRMNYGPDSGWGTSVMLMPAFWSGGTYFHGAPVSVFYYISVGKLILDLDGEIGGLDVEIKVTVMPPQQNLLTALVEVETSGGSAITLDPRPGEAFKPVFLSSMLVSSTQWDTIGVIAGCPPLVAIPESGWIISPSLDMRVWSFGLLGGTSAWKTNAPTMHITLDRQLQLAGWRTESSDPNDDNIGVWIASDQVLNSWNYTASATNATWWHCAFLPGLAR